MVVGSGLGGSLGVAVQSSYDVAVSPTRWYQAEPIALRRNKRTVQGGGLSGGTLGNRSSRRKQPTRDAGGTFEMAVVDRTMGLLFQQITGATPSIVAAGSGFLHTYAHGDITGKFFTAQAGIPELSGTVRDYNFIGSKVTSSSFTGNTDDLLMASFDLDCRDVDEDAIAFATPSYTAGLDVFDTSIAGTVVQIGGSVSGGIVTGGTTIDGVKGFSATFNRPHYNEGFYFGGAGRKKEPVQNGKTEVTGSLNADFVSKADLADRFASDVAFPLAVTFLGQTTAGFTPAVKFNFPSVHLDGDGPVLDDEDVVNTDYGFTVLQDGAGNALYSIQYTTLDSVA